jgi:Putative zinc-finger
MECHEVEQFLIEYLDGQLSPAIRAGIDKHLETCESCKQALEEYKILLHTMNNTVQEKPGPALREKFDIMLQSELNIAATARILQEEKVTSIAPVKKMPVFWRIAASVILVALGIFIGTRLTPVSFQPKPSTEIADLKTEVKQMKEALMFNLLNDESASERIKAVNYAETMGNGDQKIIDAMFNTLNNDKNLNVRLAALYSVAKFGASQVVRDSLVASLSRQTEPIMQIVLINILTERKESKAIGPIREILLNKKTMKPVKDIAQKGLRSL